MLDNIGSTEFIVIAVIGVILFGSNRVNKAARRLGEAKKEVEKAKEEYSDALSDQKEEIEEALEADDGKQQA